MKRPRAWPLTWWHEVIIVVVLVAFIILATNAIVNLI